MYGILSLYNFFQLIFDDLLGPYPRSTIGKQYLLVVLDWFTKYVLIYPIAKATSKAIVKFIENQACYYMVFLKYLVAIMAASLLVESLRP